MVVVVVRTIRSFVKRNRSLNSSQQQIWQEQKNYLLESSTILEQLEHWHDKPIVAEIGIGNGSTIFERAIHHPEHYHLGFDVYVPGIIKCLRACQNHPIQNLKIYVGDAHHCLREIMFQPSLSQAIILFPDPWTKTKHQKRRLLQPNFLTLLQQRLLPNGDVFFVTDCHHYWLEVKEYCQSHPSLFHLLTDLPIPETHFAKKAIRAGHSIYQLHFSFKSF